MRKLVLLVALTASGAAQAQYQATTPTGQAEVTFDDTSLADAGGKIAAGCMDKGWQVTNQTSNQVTCQVPFNGFKQALAGALIGNSYSTPPVVYAQFNMAQIGEDVRAQARAWMETQMAFGQVRKMDYDDKKSKSGLMSFLASLGGRLPDGTQISGAWLGIDNTAGDSSAIHIGHVYAGSPAQQAGLIDGDVITAIDGKSFKTDAEFTKRLTKIKGATYTVTAQRGGQTITANVTRRDRPAVGSPEYVAMKNQWNTWHPDKKLP